MSLLSAHNKESFDAVDVFRALLALGIVWHHMHPPVIESLGFALNVPGRVIVWLFYLLSGYVIGLGFYSGRYEFTVKSIKKFYWRRLMRIVPLLYVVYVVIFLAYFTDFSIFTMETIKELLFLKFHFEFKYIGAAWFLGPLVQVYVLAPLLMWLLLKCGVVETPRSIVVGVLMFIVLLHGIGFACNHALQVYDSKGTIIFFDNRSVLGALGPFLLGMCIEPFDQKMRWSHHPNAKKMMGLGLLLIGFCSALYYWSNKWFFVGPTSLIVTIGGALVIVGCRHMNRSEPAANLIIKLMLAIGTLSYGIFLWHDATIVPLEQQWADFDENYFTFLVAYITVMVMTTFFAWTTYELVEKRVNKMVRKTK